jgi:hypothetical protein
MSNEVIRGLKKKTIEKTIRAKIKSWVRSIEDEELKKILPGNVVITGGAIASMLLGHNPNDFDIYFRTKGIAAKVAEYYLKAYSSSNPKVDHIKVVDTPDGLGVVVYIKSAGVTEENISLDNYTLPPSATEKYFEKTEEETKEAKEQKYRVLSISSNAITLSNDIQLILRFCGDPEVIHTFYDFVHCTNYYTDTTGVVLKPLALEALLTKELKYVGSKFPLCSMFRLKKFIKRGFTITAGDMFKIAWDINKLNLEDVSVLTEQLIGMDAAYFHQILGMLKEKGYGKEGFELDRTYLFECVSRVFDDDYQIPDHEQE